MEDHLAETEEAINQITFSDVLLLNKIDLVSEEYVSILEIKLRQLNPLATIVKGHKKQFPNIDFCRNQDKLEEVLLNAKNNETQSDEALNFPVQKPNHHHHHHHTKEVNSQTFIFNSPFDFRSLQLRLTVYLTFQAKHLYRLKGLIWLENEAQQFVLQSVGKRMDFQEKRAWNMTEQKQSILVFIGKNLQRKGIEKMLKTCLSKTELTNNKNQARV